MPATPLTWLVALTTLLVMSLLVGLQFVAVVNPRGQWTLKNVYGGDPSNTDPKAFFAFYQGYAWADTFFWGPIQIAGSLGMLAGRRWGFALALLGAVPFVYSAITFYVWDRDLGYRKNTFVYWVLVWGMFPAVGALEMVYCFYRLTSI